MNTRIKAVEKIGLPATCLRHGHWYECMETNLAGVVYLCVAIQGKNFLCSAEGKNLTMTLERYTYREIKPTIAVLEFEYA